MAEQAQECYSEVKSYTKFFLCFENGLFLLFHLRGNMLSLSRKSFTTSTTRSKCCPVAVAAAAFSDKYE